jgi:hypothetical protein
VWNFNDHFSKRKTHEYISRPKRKTIVVIMSSGREGVAMTRARKRKVGERDSSWDVVANNDDVRFKHIIIPRLNRTDLKFVSSEYSTEEEHERLRNALALLENKPLPLWRLFREALLNGGACRDIVEKHVMCKLNGTDLKFFYEVNTETRKLIKRSSRKGELKKRFKVSEMSSISTLEFAWEHKSLWPSDWEDITFSSEVARTNKLELLKWAREEKKCEWDEWTINEAASQGNLEMVKYCVANECPIDEDACAYAAENGHLECLKYLREEVKAPWDFSTAEWAAENGHLHILEYLVERKYDEYNERACKLAAYNGQLECLKYLRETAKAPWNYLAVRFAHENNHTECLQYLLDNNCPLPPGWRYEDGKLHVPPVS